MKTKALPLALALLGVALASPTFAADKPEHGMMPMLQAIEPLKGAEFESAFLAHMIHHHKGGIEMAQMVPQQTQNPKLHQLAEKLIAAQTKEIGEMTGWLKEWNGKTPEDFPATPAAMEMMKADMAALHGVKDAAFDKLFSEKMTMHHREAVAMSKLVPERTKKEELEKAAAKMIKDQTAEIAQLESIKKEAKE